eukprot:TRINITY_DN39237_c0_g1_i1.p1 TRINITY_DN39237_c0_g1~~TRINITY_DN39237_c0_g1_i1.p1  ORF type:complete len:149 (+),score=15.53 TRINITY_DN39237_c0_g1_i1:147-593(+)
MGAIRRAAKLANAEEFIEGLPDGYDTCLGERATSLSGGQRQRLAVARAVYHEPAVLLLDEATSALDVRSEKLVREALQRLMINRTTLVVAHRLETIRDADRIVFLDGGCVLEQGSHDELVEKNGHYVALLRRQAPERSPSDSIAVTHV